MRDERVALKLRPDVHVNLRDPLAAPQGEKGASMRFLPSGRVRLTVLVAVVVGLTAGGVAYASIPDANGVIHGCYSPNGAKSTGGSPLKIIDSASASCSNGEQAITWNQKGPTGARGPTGANGTNGTNGTNGKNGVTGARGATGPAGASSLPDAYFATDSHVIDALAPNQQAFVTLSGLPAGTYLAWGEAGSDVDTLYCDFETGSGGSITPVAFFFAVDGGHTSTQSARVTLPSNGALKLTCGTSGGAGNTIAYGTITALKVNAAN